MILLSSGCLCCTVRDDLISTLADLHRMMRSGEVPSFTRAVVETTGLADPAPIMQAVLSAKELTSCYQLGQVITTVDGLNGARTLKSHREARQQSAMADRIVVTKCDLIGEGETDALVVELSELNPHAAIRLSGRNESSAWDLLTGSGAHWHLPPPHMSSDTPWEPSGHAHAHEGRRTMERSARSPSFPARRSTGRPSSTGSSCFSPAAGIRSFASRACWTCVATTGRWYCKGCNTCCIRRSVCRSGRKSSPPGGWIVFIARDLTTARSKIAALDAALRLRRPPGPHDPAAANEDAAGWPACQGIVQRLRRNEHHIRAITDGKLDGARRTSPPSVRSDSRGEQRERQGGLRREDRRRRAGTKRSRTLSVPKRTSTPARKACSTGGIPRRRGEAAPRSCRYRLAPGCTDSVIRASAILSSSRFTARRR